MDAMAVFSGTGLALYAAHHVGDYWVQTDHQAKHKGAEGHEGRRACLAHVWSYICTQSLFLGALALVTGWQSQLWAAVSALAVSGVTHYMADRREHGLMFKLARLLPGKADFMKLGVPRRGPIPGQPGSYDDNPSLGTGTWALDQSWHIFWGVFVPALILAAAA